jgi:magnesium-transporting ATPase (P-type)
LNQELERFSLIGLRTLLIAMKTISDEEYKTFKSERTKLKGMAAADKEKAENELIDKLEQNMFIIGATAVLDRLQDEVPETIRDLLRASTLNLI